MLYRTAELLAVNVLKRPITAELVTFQSAMQANELFGSKTDLVAIITSEGRFTFVFFVDVSEKPTAGACEQLTTVDDWWFQTPKHFG